MIGLDLKTVKAIINISRPQPGKQLNKKKLKAAIRKKTAGRSKEEIEFFCQQLIPYVLEQKNKNNLIKEPFVRGVKKKFQQKIQQARDVFAENREKYKFYTICKGDLQIFENTYGYLPRIIDMS